MMIKQTGPKILAIGSSITISRFCAKTAGGQFLISGCRNPAEAALKLAKEDFDMIVIDSLVKNAESIGCVSAGCGAPPVVLLLQEKPIDWKGMWSAAVDGFLADGGTNAEFVARLQACLRRKNQLGLRPGLVC